MTCWRSTEFNLQNPSQELLPCQPCPVACQPKFQNPCSSQWVTSVNVPQTQPSAPNFKDTSAGFAPPQFSTVPLQYPMTNTNGQFTNPQVTYTYSPSPYQPDTTDRSIFHQHRDAWNPVPQYPLQSWYYSTPSQPPAFPMSDVEYMRRVAMHYKQKRRETRRQEKRKLRQERERRLEERRRKEEEIEKKWAEDKEEEKRIEERRRRDALLKKQREERILARRSLKLSKSKPLMPDDSYERILPVSNAKDRRSISRRSSVKRGKGKNEKNDDTSESSSVFYPPRRLREKLVALPPSIKPSKSRSRRRKTEDISSLSSERTSRRRRGSRKKKLN